MNQSAAYQVVIPQWVPWVALSLTVALAGLIAYLVRREKWKNEGSDIMRRRNLQFLLLLVLLIYIPQTTYAENRETTEVGIGFTKTSDIPSKNPVVNVLPQTTIQSLSIVRSRTQIKRLPKTGDNRITWLSWFGILFLISSFWLFLFRQLCRKGE